jgi:lipoprotein-releasing system permease protein
VVGTFDSGHFEYDSGLVLLHQEDAARIFRLEGPTGIRLKRKDLHQARAVAAELGTTLTGEFVIRDWTRQNRTWFAAVELEKRMMFIILTLIVAVAAFNLVSTLVMTVTDKRADIAILRTLGASPGSVMGIFVVQGAAVGVIGTLGGLLLGLGVALKTELLYRSRVIQHLKLRVFRQLLFDKSPDLFIVFDDRDGNHLVKIDKSFAFLWF